MKSILNNNGLLITKPINPQQFKKLIKDLKLQYKIKISKNLTTTKFLECYKIQNNGILVPRNYGIEITGNTKVVYDKILPILKYDNTTLKLDDNQEIVYNYIMKNYFNSERLKKGLAICLLQMDTGLGKSYLASAIVKQLSVKTCIIAPKKAIVEEWRDIFLHYFPDISVSICVGKEEQETDIVILTFKTAYTKSTDFYKKFSFTIIDEIHLTATERYKNILFNTNSPFVLGMTATPDERIDGFDDFYKLYLGDPLMAEKVPGFQKDNVSFTGSVYAIQYRGPAEYTEKQINDRGGTICIQKCVQLLEKDPRRNEIILSSLIDMFSKGYKTFIFAENVSFLQYLHDNFKNMLQEKHYASRYKVLGVDNTGKNTIFLMTGGVDNYKEIKENCEVVFTTYGYSSEGISFPQMNSIIFATPRKNKMRQILGRVLRRNGDTSIHRVIIDIVDVNTIFKKQFYTRNNVYNLKDYNVIKV